MGKYGLGGHKLGEGGGKNLFSAFRRNCGWTVVAERIFPAIRRVRLSRRLSRRLIVSREIRDLDY